MDMMAAVAVVGAHLAAKPRDGGGHDVLAPIYMQLGRYADAARALAQASRLLGATAEREAMQAEAHMLAGQGRMTPEAREAVARALAIEPALPQARFYAGMAAEEDGDKARAGEIEDFTGISAPYEAPESPEVFLPTEGRSVDECAGAIADDLERRGFIPAR